MIYRLSACGFDWLEIWATNQSEHSLGNLVSTLTANETGIYLTVTRISTA